MEFDEKQFRKDVISLLANEAFDLFDLIIKRMKASTLIRIYADNEMGITVEDCAHLSREISKMIDIKYEEFSNYRIEVSSPGIMRTLKTEKDFHKNLNRNVAIQYSSHNQKTNLEGNIHHTTDKAVYVQHGDEIECINYDMILNAKLKLQW